MDIGALIARGVLRASARPRLLLALTLAAALAAFAALGGVRLAEDVRGLLPDDGSGLAEDFRLLGLSPLSRLALVEVRAAPGATPEELAAAAGRLAGALDPAFFSEILALPSPAALAGLMTLLLDHLPDLADDSDLAAIRATLAPGEVARRLARDLALLASPEGWWQKELIRQDPLDWRRLAAAKLAGLRPAQSVRPAGPGLLAPDGQSLLILALSPVPMTDSARSAELLAGFEASTAALPPGFTAGLVCGHRYTAANAAAVKSDLAVVLTASSLALVLIFLVFLRLRQALLVALVPLAVLPPAALLSHWLMGGLSGITLGFGAVLMGIGVDYALHVALALEAGDEPAPLAVGRVSRPVLAGAATSLAAFGALAFSSLPVVRQLALFSIIGLILALILALFVLPALLPAGTAGGRPRRPAGRPAGLPAPRRGLALVLLLAVLACGLWWGRQVRFDADLRALGSRPADVLADEARVRERFGRLRDQALVFASAPDLEAALALNETAWRRLRGQAPGTSLTSLAPVLPSAATQAANRARFEALLDAGAKDALGRELADSGRALGFAPGAFRPFEDRLGAAAPAPLTPADLRRSGLGPLLDLMLVETPGRVHLLTLAPDDPDVARLFPAEPGAGQGLRLLSQARFTADLTRAMRADFIRFLAIALAANLVLLRLFLPGWRAVALVMLPLAAGLAGLFGFLGLTGRALNLFGILALPLILGIGVDYGVFIYWACCGRLERAAHKAVLVAGLTTLAGFGSLLLARHPALHAIGLTVTVGVAAALAASLCILPALLGRRP